MHPDPKSMGDGDGTNPRQRRGEIRALTGLRGVAALMIVFYHYGDLGKWGWTPIRPLFAHGYLAVDLFFVLSGFVIALGHSGEFRTRVTSTGYARFMLTRLGRVYPLYLATTLVCCLFACLGIDPTTNGLLHGAAKLVVNVLMLQSVGISSCFDLVAWSICTEMIAYLLFPLACRQLLFGKAHVAWAAGPVCLIVVALLASVPASWDDPWVVSRATRHAWLDLAGNRLPFPLLRCLSEFTLGMVAWRARQTMAGAWFAQSNLAGLAMAVLTVGLLLAPDSDVFFVAALPFLVLSLAADRSPAAWCLGGSIARSLGLISYSIYLVHPLIESVARAMLPSDAWDRDATIWTEIALMLAVSTLTYIAIERPGRRHSRALLARWQPADHMTERLAAPAAG